MKKTKSFAMLALVAVLALPTMAQRQLTVQANKFTGSALDKIAEAGGKAEVV